MTAPLRARSTRRPAIRDSRLLAEVLRGLRSDQKTLSPKLFYDSRGTRLFKQICTLDEYYLTRAELEILTARGADIAAIAGPRCAVVEYGAGTAAKAALLLQALPDPAAYVPVDISPQQLRRSLTAVRAHLGELPVLPIRADYERAFRLPELPDSSRRIAFFPGSTIGNMHPPDAARFLCRLRADVGPDGAVLLGVDRLKDRGTLEAAYNDRAGVTAAFNLNILARLNRDCGATFRSSDFRHRAFLNEQSARIEMHLESVRPQVVSVGSHPISFRSGETIWTESSYKYDRASLDAVAQSAGLAVRRLWTDSRNLFWLAYLEPSAS